MAEGYVESQETRGEGISLICTRQHTQTHNLCSPAGVWRHAPPSTRGASAADDVASSASLQSPYYYYNNNTNDDVVLLLQESSPLSLFINDIAPIKRILLLFYF